MAGLRFGWDDRKNVQNRRKHGVSFEEAQMVFFDEHALLIADPDHSGQEERFVLLGLGGELRMLVVCHCYLRPVETWFGSFRLDERTGGSVRSTRSGGDDEETVRLLEG